MKVFVYFNLHKKLFSIKALDGINKGKVIAHLDNVQLSNVTFKVSAKGRQRVLKEKRKNVHAGVVGYLCTHDLILKNKVSYNPYKQDSFYLVDSVTPIYTTDYSSLRVLDKIPYVFV